MDFWLLRVVEVPWSASIGPGIASDKIGVPATTTPVESSVKTWPLDVVIIIRDDRDAEK